MDIETTDSQDLFSGTHDKHPLLLLLIFCGFFMAGLFIGQFFALVLLYPFIGNEVMNLGSIVSDPTAHPQYRNAILFLQGFTSLAAMVIAPLLFIHFFYKKRLHFFENIPDEILFLATILLVIVSIPANTWIADLNLQMKLPAYLAGWEQWAATKEQELKILTEYLTFFTSQGQFYFGLIVIALIPAVGEELMFRGVIQTTINRWSHNAHLAIWGAAFLFSAIHLQFYGFFPRMFLGALFGYLFTWTGNMLIPMLAHFTNNAFTLLLIHLKNQNKLKMDIETTKEMPVELILGSFLLFCLLIFLFRNQAIKHFNIIRKNKSQI